MTDEPKDMETRLRQISAGFAPGQNFPDWFASKARVGGNDAWRDLLMEAADELEQRSLLSGRLLRRLAGD